MIKGIELLKKADDLKKAVNSKDKVRYVFLALLSLTWGLFYWFSSEDVKLLDILMAFVIGVFYLGNEFEGHRFAMYVHKILLSMENAGGAINNLREIIEQLNTKVKKDETYRKEIDDFRNSVDSKFTTIDQVLNGLLEFIKKGGK